VTAKQLDIHFLECEGKPTYFTKYEIWRLKVDNRIVWPDQMNIEGPRVNKVETYL
jgi:hypothetical protein